MAEWTASDVLLASPWQGEQSLSDVRSIEAGEAVPPLSFFKEKEN